VIFNTNTTNVGIYIKCQTFIQFEHLSPLIVLTTVIICHSQTVKISLHKWPK